MEYFTSKPGHRRLWYVLLVIAIVMFLVTLMLNITGHKLDISIGWKEITYPYVNLSNNYADVYGPFSWLKYDTMCISGPCPQSIPDMYINNTAQAFNIAWMISLILLPILLVIKLIYLIAYRRKT